MRFPRSSSTTRDQLLLTSDEEVLDPTPPLEEDHRPTADDGPPPTPLPSFSAADAAVRAELASLRTLFEDRLRYDEAREEHFSRLYAELEGYKRNDASERMLALARSLLLVLDKLDDEERGEADRHISDELLECLATVGVDRIETPLETAAPPEQEIVGFLEDEDGDAVRTVTEGYRYESRVLRPRRVLVKRTTESGRSRRDA